MSLSAEVTDIEDLAAVQKAPDVGVYIAGLFLQVIVFCAQQTLILEAHAGLAWTAGETRCF